MFKKAVSGVALAVLVWGTIAMLPDLIRYMRIRQM
jgi:hypothetical protein